MFRNKQQIDVKKLLQKFVDIKKESLNRLRHLRVLLDNIDIKESKELFEHQFTHIYYVFFDSFINLDTAYKQRNHKTNKEELDLVFAIFDKILTLLPELLNKRWQMQSILIIMKKLIHHSNTVKVRLEGMRLFLIWYQILGNDCADVAELEQMFASLVPGLVPSLPNYFLQSQQQLHTTDSLIHDPNGNTVMQSEVTTVALNNLTVQSCSVEPFMQSFHTEQQPHDVTCYYLQCLMDYMITQVSKIHWSENRELKQIKCFEFLFMQFRRVYLSHIFPSLTDVCIYNPCNQLPTLRKHIDDNNYYEKSRFSHRDTLIVCQSIVLRWLSKYLKYDGSEISGRKESIDDQPQYSKLFPMHQILTAQESYTEWREPTNFEYDIIRNTFNSSRDYVNLMHSLFQQAFLLPFSHAVTMRKVISVYRDWIYRATFVVPTFIEEPFPLSNTNNNNVEDVRAGFDNLLRVFVSIAANVFLLEVPIDKPLMLEEQVDMCKRVLNIYRYMVMKIDMGKHVWERLLEVLLQITALVLKENIPLRKDDTLGGRLAPAFFQTLIVTWIKANLQLNVSTILWEKFHDLISSLTKWEELIKEWSKTMDTLTRVMARYVYNINLHDLPLERISERTKKKTVRGNRNDVKVVTQNIDVSVKTTQANTDTKTVKRMRSNSGDSPYSPDKSISSHLNIQNIVRSRSDSQLSKYSFNRSTNKHETKRSVDKSFSRRESSAKSRSLECINRNESPLLSEYSMSRSPSPTHSNAIESNSLKDSPMHIESNVQNTSNVGSSAKSVLIGGTYRGWCAESALILWRRMLGILGDINKLSDPAIHAQAMECLVKIVEDLIKVKENLGICVDNQPISAPQLQPPLHFFASWLFKATLMPNEFKVGKLLAYKLLCIITVRRNEIELSKEFLSLFYLIVRQGLITYDMEITSTIIKYCGAKFFSLGLPGSSSLLFDFINAANSIVSSNESKLPRAEALFLLGSLIGLNTIFSNIIVLQSRTTQPSLILYKDAKEHVLEIILNASKREQTGLGRSIALSSLGLFLYQELHNRTNHPKLKEITNVLIAGTRVSLKIPKLISEHSNPNKFNNRVLSRVACEMLRLQCDHSTYLLDNHPEIPKKIIEGLCVILMSHITLVQQQNMFKEYKNILLTIMFCVGEWCMSVPKIFLKHTVTAENPNESLMAFVLRCFSTIANVNTIRQNSYQQNTLTASNVNEQEIDFTINSSFDTSESGLSPKTSPKKKSLINLNFESKIAPNFVDSSKEDTDANAIRLAANMIIGQFLNYLGHFPQSAIGAVHLSCLVNENDDNCLVPNVEKIDLDVLNAPNVLFFIVNDSSIVSFTELTDTVNCEYEVDENVNLSKTTVRTIVRNLTGKFAWDCRQLNSITNEKLNFDSYQKVLTKREVSKDNQNRYNYGDNDESKICTKKDELELLVQHLRDTSAECFDTRENPTSNSFNSLPDTSDMIALLANQHFQEKRFVEENASKTVKSIPVVESDGQSSMFKVGNTQLAFQHCRQLIDQMGYLFWEKRNRIDLLCKNQNIVREIRNLDNQKCRETHKIAVIYVGKGQEDKDSILSNTAGSKAFEEFVSGLGWEVNLESHLGFRGGLQENESTGKSAPYYANSYLEIMFHVSTRISNADGEQMTKKMRHLGNDEVHIVWSEHTRDYRRGIIPTEFCDALIVIYPLLAYQSLYYIQISRKPEVPFFGPLFNGAVVHQDILASLVRATAINASRAKRMHIPFYLNHFEERARSIDSIVKNCKEKSCFEDFSSKIYSPKELESSRSISSLSGGVDALSLSSANNSMNYFDGQQSPQRRNRPSSSINSEQRTVIKIN